MDRRHDRDCHEPSGAAFARSLPWQIAAAATLAAAAALYPSATWAWLALLLFVTFLAALARHAPAAFLLLLPLLVLRLSELASGAAIEGGAMMTESGFVGHPTGAFVRLLLLDLLVLSAAALLIERGWRKLRPLFAACEETWDRHGRAFAIALAAVLSGVTLILAILAFRHGLPLFSGTDRFAYLNRLEGTPYRTIIMNRAIVAPLIGVLIAIPRTRRAGAFLLLWLLLLSLLFGEKFTSLLFILAGAIQPWALMTLASNGTLPWRPIALCLLLLGAISLPATLVAYGGLHDPGRAWHRLQDRAAVQGQLWYLADLEGPPSRLDSSAFHQDVASWARPLEQRPETAGTRFGLYYAMARLTPSHRLNMAVHGKNGFVFALYPYLLLAGGTVVLIAGAVIVSLVQALALLLLAAALASGRRLAALAFARVTSATYACVITGYLWNLFGVKTLLTFAIGLALLTLDYQNSVRVRKILFNRK